MRLIETLIEQLGRAEVSEFAVVSGRLPCAKVRTAFEPVGEPAPSRETVLQMLASVGGSRYLDSLGERPISWKIRLPGAGSVSVTAISREGCVQVRIKSLEALADRVAAGSLASRSGPPPRTEDGRGETTPAREGSSGKLPISLRSVPQQDDALSIELDHDPAQVRRGADRGSLVPSVTRHVESSPVVLDKSDIAFLLLRARQAKASDLHIIADTPPLLRIAGELGPSGDVLTPAEVDAMLLPLIPERLRATFTTDGSCDFALQHARCGRFRVNVNRQRTGLKGCFRLIADEIPTLDSLGLPQAVGLATFHHQGLILVTGPTGHGKTSTLTALVDLINSDTTHHIITVEDPVEYVHPRKKAMMSQREVGTHTRSFAAALKGSLREDPDVIVVGEMRDTETVRMALSASETGHLVIGTMNTPSAAKAIDRVIDLFPPGDQPQVRMSLSGGLRLIVGQRLLRGTDGKRAFAAAEVLPGSIALSNLIRDNKTFQIPSLQQRGKSLGIIRIDDSLVDLVHSGSVTLDAARAVAEDPDELEKSVAQRSVVKEAEPPPQAAGGLFSRATSLLTKKQG